MGGGGGAGRIFRDAAGVMFAAPTGGLSLGLGPDTQRASPFNLVKPTLDNVTGVTAAKQARDSMNASLAYSQANAAEMQKQMLSAPKTMTPDNFLAMKNKELMNLRLGISSTIRGGGASSPTVSTPVLAAGGPGKS